MAKRMISLEVVDTDAFLDMPQSSQLLYFHLNARADDDGFVANPKRVMRDMGSQLDDIKLLVAKKFLISFEDGVVVIKHWRINNYIRKDIYKETKYLNHRQTLFIRPNGAYTLTDDGRAKRLPNGHFNVEDIKLKIGLPKPRKNVHVTSTERALSIDKVSIDKNSIETEKISVPFSLKEEIKKMEENSRRDMQIIGFYFSERMPDIRNKEQLQQAIRRHLRAAKALTPFDDDQLVSGFKKAKNQTPEWVLETVVKMITK